MLCCSRSCTFRHHVRTAHAYRRSFSARPSLARSPLENACRSSSLRAHPPLARGSVAAATPSLLAWRIGCTEAKTWDNFEDIDLALSSGSVPLWVHVDLDTCNGYEAWLKKLWDWSACSWTLDAMLETSGQHAEYDQQPLFSRFRHPVNGDWASICCIRGTSMDYMTRARGGDGIFARCLISRDLLITAQIRPLNCGSERDSSYSVSDTQIRVMQGKTARPQTTCDCIGIVLTDIARFVTSSSDELDVDLCDIQHGLYRAGILSSLIGREQNTLDTVRHCAVQWRRFALQIQIMHSQIMHGFPKTVGAGMLGMAGPRLAGAWERSVTLESSCRVVTEDMRALQQTAIMRTLLLLVGLLLIAVLASLFSKLIRLHEINEAMWSEHISPPCVDAALDGMEQKVLQTVLNLCWDYSIHGVNSARAGHIVVVGPADEILKNGTVRGRNWYADGGGSDSCIIQEAGARADMKLEMNQQGAHIINGVDGRIVANKFFFNSSADPESLSVVRDAVVLKVSKDGSLTEFRNGQLFHKHCDARLSPQSARGNHPWLRSLAEFEYLQQQKMAPVSLPAPGVMNQNVLQAALELCWDYSINGIEGDRAGHVVAVGPAEQLLKQGYTQGRNVYAPGPPCLVENLASLEDMRVEMNQDGAHIVDGKTGRVVAGKFFANEISKNTTCGGSGKAAAQALSTITGTVVFKISSDGSVKEFRGGRQTKEICKNRPSPA